MSTSTNGALSPPVGACKVVLSDLASMVCNGYWVMRKEPILDAHGNSPLSSSCLQTYPVKDQHGAMLVNASVIGLWGALEIRASMHCPDPNCVYKPPDAQDTVRGRPAAMQEVSGTRSALRVSSVSQESPLDVTDDVTDAASSLDLKEGSTADGTYGDEEISAEVGSNGEAEFVDEDILRDENTQATGYVGKGSVIQWLRHLRMEVDAFEQDKPTPEKPHRPPGQDEAAASQRLTALGDRKQSWVEHPLGVSDSTFYLDCKKLPVAYDINPFDLPPTSVARRLIDTYTHTVQDTFPILSMAVLENEYRNCYTLGMQEKLFLVPGKRLALLNLVFAIGAKHLDLVQTGLQNSALLALYLTSVGRVNRAWVVLGTSLRCAHALGLHVRNEYSNITVAEQELRSRMWWALHNLEENQSMILGRPVLLSDSFCSTTLPLPLSVEQLSDEAATAQLDISYKADSVRQIASRIGSAASDPANSGSYLMALARVSQIAQEAMAELYSPGAMEQSLKQMQKKIKDFCDQLEEWSASLPAGFRFAPAPSDDRFRRERFILEMHHSRVKILITRPCLCWLDHRIAPHTEGSNSFNTAGANACVKAAKAVASMLPDHINVARLYSDGPWWSVVHHLTEAIMVLILGISHKFIHIPGDDDALVQLQKPFQWLAALKDGNEVADRSYSTTSELLQRIGQRMEVDFSAIIREDPAPQFPGDAQATAAGNLPQALSSAPMSKRLWGS
ncbi:hypothetical protein EJ07DRAFT_154663 [Lizonia empirigonia]|nr:hypothetical protein EJ07DRAFT_154663 [Lizonia empirigonia]